jgi:hypothetical protein
MKYFILVLSALLLINCSFPFHNSIKKNSSSGTLSKNIINNYSFTDARAPSYLPPVGIEKTTAPVFVALGIDDCKDSNGVSTIISLFSDAGNNPTTDSSDITSNSPVGVTFFMEGKDNKSNIARVVNNSACEVGNHTYNHVPDSSDWANEIQKMADEVSSMLQMGFRKPEGMFIDDSNYSAREKMSSLLFSLYTNRDKNRVIFDSTLFIYPNDNQTQYIWPYTMDNYSDLSTFYLPLDIASDKNAKNLIATVCPGLWELPMYDFIIPPDLMASKNYKTSIIAPVDLSMWSTESNVGLGMTAQEGLSVLEYNLFLRLHSNSNSISVPMIMTAHDYNFSSVNNTYNITASEQENVYRKFLTFAKQFPEVKIVTYSQLLNWLKNPTPLSFNYLKNNFIKGNSYTSMDGTKRIVVFIADLGHLLLTI